MADSPLPLYHKVYLLIRQRLLAGGFAPQTALPGENALAAEYGVSRLTIRRSLEALEADGLIERHQGRGHSQRCKAPRRPPSTAPTWTR
ncbi:deoR-like helix-turn-helix domain protein [Bordetella holmesii 70147]|nr:deoR-like helix-turn-helix domain protein [Bordetella holmesii 70147]